MLSKTYRMFEDRLDYTKGADGSWTAQFRGPFDVRVTEPSLDRCRCHAFDELDVNWPHGSHGQSRESKSAGHAVC